jgi:hypothetical protein
MEYRSISYSDIQITQSSARITSLTSLTQKISQMGKAASQLPSSSNPKPRFLDVQFEESVLEPLSQTIEIAIIQGIGRTHSFHNLNPMFVLASAPQMSIAKYLRRLATYLPCSRECYIIATVLLGKFEATLNSPILSPQTAHPLLLTAILIAHKLHDDNTMRNSRLAEIAGVDVHHLNSMESEFLRNIDYQTFISPSQFEKYQILLNSMASKKPTNQTQFEPMKFQTC